MFTFAAMPDLRAKMSALTSNRQTMAIHELEPINPKRAGIFGQSKSRGGRNPPAVVFVLLYGQFPCKSFIKGSQMKAGIFIYM